ncbi:MAG: hypothetical protein SFZ03_04835 [Candidatus Melainabacteria bacterium]|nr:hypothetical protein [Candidatus Melainabacteria bacterium]
MPKYRNIYHEKARWRCHKLATGERFMIHGPLAQILKQYPHAFVLTFLSPTGGSIEWPPS